MRTTTFIIVAISLLFSSFSIYAVDKDNDGVDDTYDKCPNTHQIKKLSPDFIYGAAVNPDRLKSGKHSYPVNSDGCEPDNDKDGVVNSQDYCPDDTPHALAMGISANGCPRQSDADGTPDYRDRCPNTPPGVKTDQYGCEMKRKIL